MSFASWRDIPALYGSDESLATCGEAIEDGTVSGLDLISLDDSRGTFPLGAGANNQQTMCMHLGRKFRHVPRLHSTLALTSVSPVAANALSALGSSSLLVTSQQATASHTVSGGQSRKLSGTGVNTGWMQRVDTWLNDLHPTIRQNRQPIFNGAARLRFGLVTRAWESGNSQVGIRVYRRADTVINTSGNTLITSETLDASAAVVAGSPNQYATIRSSWHDCSTWLGVPYGSGHQYIAGNWHTIDANHNIEFCGGVIESEDVGGVSPIYFAAGGYTGVKHLTDHGASLEMMDAFCGVGTRRMLGLFTNVNDAYGSLITPAQWMANTLDVIEWARGKWPDLPVLLAFQAKRLADPGETVADGYFYDYLHRAVEICDSVSGVVMIQQLVENERQTDQIPHGLRWRGAYNGANTYLVDDYCTNGGNVWRRITGSGSDAPPSGNWRQIDLAWNIATSYNPGDCCTQAGRSYTWRGLSAASGVQPGTGDRRWVEVSPYTLPEYVHPHQIFWNDRNSKFVDIFDGLRKFAAGRNSAPAGGGLYYRS